MTPEEFVKTNNPHIIGIGVEEGVNVGVGVDVLNGTVEDGVGVGVTVGAEDTTQNVLIT